MAAPFLGVLGYHDVTSLSLLLFPRRYRLTRLAVDASAGPSRNGTVLFLGSEEGTVLKVLSRPTGNHTMQTLLLEEVAVYQPSR